MYTFVDNLDKDTYENFVRNNKYTHFMQSYDFGIIREFKRFTPRYVALLKNNTILCAALLLEKVLKNGNKYYYSPRGYVIDWDNKELLKIFTKKIKEYAKKNKAMFVKIDPGLKRHNLDPDGNIIGNENNYALIKYLKKIGYKHQGYNKGFEGEQPRFTFRIDLNDSWDNIYARMHPTTRKILNKGNQYNLEVYKGTTQQDIEDFYDTMKETSVRDGIIQSRIEYYDIFWRTFNKDGLSDLYIVKVNIQNLIKTMNDKIKSVEDDIKRLSQKEKNAGKVSDLKIQLTKLNEELKEYKSIKEKEVILSSIITVKYGDMVWTVHGGNNTRLLGLNANYLCYYEIMKDAYNEGYKCMDCFGTCGIANPDKTNPIYGIHSFKKRLGGEFVEFIGEFDLIIKPIPYLIHKIVTPIKIKMYRKKHRVKQS